MLVPANVFDLVLVIPNICAVRFILYRKQALFLLHGLHPV